MDNETFQQLIHQVKELINNADNEISKSFFQKELDRLIKINNDFQKLNK